MAAVFVRMSFCLPEELFPLLKNGDKVLLENVVEWDLHHVDVSDVTYVICG